LFLLSLGTDVLLCCANLEEFIVRQGRVRKGHTAVDNTEYYTETQVNSHHEIRLEIGTGTFFLWPCLHGEFFASQVLGGKLFPVDLLFINPNKFNIYNNIELYLCCELAGLLSA
jgi:hypothetical protein